MSCEDGNMCNGVYSCHEDTGTCELDTPVVNCDDGNACTINTCDTSTGQCSTVDKNCDDGNPCTLNDSCDSSTGCVIQPPTEKCCGNFQCEALGFNDVPETMETCPQDCSTSISTEMKQEDNPDKNTPFYGYMVSSSFFLCLPFEK